MQSLRGKHSSAWLTVLPSERETMMPNNTFLTALRLRLGLAPASTAPARCCCGKAALDTHPWHHLDCSRMTAGPATARHNLVTQTLAGWVRKVGGSAWVEPTGLFLEDERRVDLLVALADRRIVLDVQIRNPLAPSNIQGAAAREGGLLEAGERAKRQKYERFARQHNFEFVPFVLETTGGFGKGAVELVSVLVEFARTTRPDLRAGEVRSGIIGAVSCSVATGNALMVRTGLQRAGRELMRLPQQ